MEWKNMSREETFFFIIIRNIVKLKEMNNSSKNNTQ